MHHLMCHNMKNRASFCGIPSRDKQPKSLQNRASLEAQRVKNWPAMWRPGFDPWVRKNSWRRTWQPTLVFLPGEFLPTRLQSTGLQRVGHDSATSLFMGKYFVTMYIFVFLIKLSMYLFLYTFIHIYINSWIPSLYSEI